MICSIESYVCDCGPQYKCHICHQSCEVKRYSYKKIFSSQLNIIPVKLYIYKYYISYKFPNKEVNMSNICILLPQSGR